jgi:bifunctional DNA-binding transcriptional regulator/antitoxin component of YhaV-PrlF toxin-antitoxin module
MSVGPKGQVVILVALRKILKITSDSKVIFKGDGYRIILGKLRTDSVNIFGGIAKKGKSVNEIAYNEYKNKIFKMNKL